LEKPRYFASGHPEQGLETTGTMTLIDTMELSTPLFTFNTKDFRFIDGLQLYTSPMAT